MQVQCPYCKQKYDVEEDAIGQKADCQSCGKEFIVNSTADTASSARRSHPYEDGEPKVQKKRTVMVATVSMALISLVGIILVSVFVMRDTWERDNAQHIAQLCDTIGQLASEGKTTESLSEYGKLQSLLGDRKLKNPMLTQSVSRARETEQKLRAEQINLATIHAMEEQAKTFVDNGNLELGIEKYSQILDYIAKAGGKDAEFARAITRISQSSKQTTARLALQRKAEAEQQERRKKEEERLNQQRDSIARALAEAEAERTYDKAISILETAIAENPNAGNLTQAQEYVQRLRAEREEAIRQQKVKEDAAIATANNPFSSSEALALYFLKKVSSPWSFTNPYKGGRNTVQGTVRSADAFVGTDRARVEFYIINSYEGKPVAKTTFRLSFVKNFGTWEFDSYTCSDELAWSEDYVRYLIRGLTAR